MTLRAWYKLDGLNGSGFVPDCSGNDNDGTPTNITFGQWDGRQAASFNGSSSFISLGSPSSLNTSRVTVALWIKASSAPTVGGQVVFNRLNTLAGTVAIYSNNRGILWGAQIRLNGSEATDRTVYSDGPLTTEWTHVALTYDGSTLRMYVNGMLQADTLDVSGTIDTDSFTSINIGRHPTSGQYFDGLMGDFRICNAALPIEKIQAIYRDRKSRPYPWQSEIVEPTVEEVACYGR